MIDKRNKKGQFADVFIFMISAFIILVVSGLFIYIGIETTDKMHEALDPISTPETNYSELIDETMGEVNTAYTVLYWGSVLIIIGMVLGIFIGSWLVNKNPLWFIPWIILVIISLVVAVILSNAYEEIINIPELSSAFDGFVGGNFIMGYLPVWVTILAFFQAVIMFIAWGKRRSDQNVFIG